MTTFLEYLDRIDKTVYEYIFLYANPDWLVNVCHILVKQSTIFPFLVLFFILYARKNPKESLYLLISTLVLLAFSEIIASKLKELVGRHRPVYHMGMYISDGGFSFPSAHAVNTMAFAVLWGNRFRSIAPYLFSMSIIIGFSRMVANYHFPGDILGGWITGYFAGKLFVTLLEKFEFALHKNFNENKN